MVDGANGKLPLSLTGEAVADPIAQPVPGAAPPAVAIRTAARPSSAGMESTITNLPELPASLPPGGPVSIAAPLGPAVRRNGFSESV
jgi:hypothetical protein